MNMLNISSLNLILTEIWKILSKNKKRKYSKRSIRQKRRIFSVFISMSPNLITIFYLKKMSNTTKITLILSSMLFPKLLKVLSNAINANILLKIIRADAKKLKRNYWYLNAWNIKVIKISLAANLMKTSIRKKKTKLNKPFIKYQH